MAAYRLNGFIVDPRPNGVYGIFKTVNKRPECIAVVQATGTGDAKRFHILDFGNKATRYKSLSALTNDLKTLRPVAVELDADATPLTAHTTQNDLREENRKRADRQAKALARRNEKQRAELQAILNADNTRIVELPAAKVA